MTKTSKNVSKLAQQYSTAWTNASTLTGLNPNNFTITTQNITSSNNFLNTQPAITWGGTTTVPQTNWTTVPYNPNQYGSSRTYTVPANMGTWSATGTLLPYFFKELLATYGITIDTKTGSDRDWSDLLGQMTDEVQGYYYFRMLMLNKAENKAVPDYMHYQINPLTRSSLNDKEEVVLECMIANIMMKGLKGNKTRIRALRNPDTSEESALYLLLRHMSKVIRKVGIVQSANGENTIIDHYKLLVPYVVKPLSVIYSGL